MTRKTSFSTVMRRWTAAPLCLAAGWTAAQTPAPAARAPAERAMAAPDSGIGAPVSARPDLKLPELRDLSVAVPRPVRAASALLGMGRQRLALVVGISTVGARQVVDSAGRDAQAVAAALREGGFVVMLREDLGSADLRAALKEFHERLQPGGIGFAYVAGLGAQVQGQNLLLPRDSNLDPALPAAERQAQWLKTGVPLSDVVDALMGPTGSPRMLVVDAAYQNPALNGLPAPGLAAQRLPPGMMALYGHPLGKTQDVPAVGDLPNPPPTDARELAASPFARALVAQLLAPRKRGPEVLRATHRSLLDGSLGQNELWIAGDTDNEELAEASLLDVIPRTPEEIARELASQAGRALTRHTASAAASTGSVTASASTAVSTATAAGSGAVGEQSVADVLDRAPRAQPGLNPEQAPTSNMRPSSARNAVPDTAGAPSAPAGPAAPSLPDVPRAPTSLLSQAASVGSAISTAAGVAGTVASVATTVATAAVMAKATEAAATVSAATTAIGAAGSVAGQMMALAVRSVSGSAGEPQAAAVQQMASRASATAAAKAAAPAAAAVAQAAAPAAVTASARAAATTAAAAPVVAAAAPAVASTTMAAAAPALASTGAAAAAAAPGLATSVAAAAAPVAAAPLLANALPSSPSVQSVPSAQAVQGAPALSAGQVTSLSAVEPAALGGRGAQMAAAGTAPLGAAALPGTGVPGASPRAPARANANASASPGDMPVEQFGPSTPAAAATTSAAATTATANAARSEANGLLGEASNSAALPEGTGLAANAVPPANPAGTGVTRTASAAQASKPGLEAPDNRTVRNAEGGERPAYTPRTNSYGYAEGDTYTYQVMDTWKEEVINRYTTAIEEVLPDGQMLANGQRTMMDAQGRLLKRANADGSISKFEPSEDLWWSNPKRGESRDLRFTETVQRANGRSSEIEWKGSTSVGKVQKIDTPAGEFEVLPIESSGWAYEVLGDGLRSTKWSRTVWYSTKLGHPVAIDIQDADRLGKLLRRERVELLHAQASRVATP
jgi:hypothetical protein